MHNRPEPWKWPVCCGVAVALLLVAVFGFPRRWLDFLLPPATVFAVQDGSTHSGWLILQPPPVIEILAPREHRPPQVTTTTTPPVQEPDPLWWRQGVVAASDAQSGLFRPSSTDTDTLLVFLRELGLGADFMTGVRPDSVVAARLFLLQVEDRFRYEELKPLMMQVQRSRVYADIMSRSADMYGDHLEQTIQVPHQR